LVNLGKGMENHFRIINNNNKNCSDYTKWSTQWTLRRQQISNNSNLQYYETMSNYCSLKYTQTNEFKLKRNELQFGTYSLQGYAFLTAQPWIYKKLNEVIFTITLSPLNVDLNLNASVQLNWNETLNLDFYSKSFDPETNGNDGVYYDLFCIEGDTTVQNKLQQKVKDLIDLKDFSKFETLLSFEKPFSSDQYRIRFFEKNCILHAPLMNGFQGISFQSQSKQITIDANILALNDTTVHPLIFQLVAYTNDGRTSMSNISFVSLNISSLNTITVNSFKLNFDYHSHFHSIIQFKDQ
jgi:hypothetical protein